MLNALRDHSRRLGPAGLAAAILAVVVTIGVGSSRAGLPSDAAGVPFVTFAHATAEGNYGLACEQIAQATLMRKTTPRPRTLGAARQACALALSSQARDLDQEQLRRLASTRVVKIRVVNPGRAHVTVQTTLYGVKPRATGTAILEGGQWKIAKPASGAHVGSSLVLTVPSSSMVPTLRAGDTILVDRNAYRHAKPRIGDIVVFHPPAGALRQRQCGKRPPAGQACSKATPRNSGTTFVKRVVAHPGNRVSIRRGRVIRNGKRASEDFVTPCGQGGGCDFPRRFTVAAGRYYLLGDNRGESDDSRYWGPVSARSIVGRVRRLDPPRRARVGSPARD